MLQRSQYLGKRLGLDRRVRGLLGYSVPQPEERSHDGGDRGGRGGYRGRGGRGRGGRMPSLMDVSGGYGRGGGYGGGGGRGGYRGNYGGG